MKLTLEALAERGHEIVVAFPGEPPRAGEAPAGVQVVRVEEKRRPWAAASLAGLARGLPASALRHASPALEREVRGLMKGSPDVVFAEQLQALPACASAFERRVPVVLRAQNVESDLWAARASSASRGRLLLRWEGKKMAAWEATAIRRCAGTIALTAPDAARLRELAGPSRPIAAIPAPFPGELAAGEVSLPGSPAVVVFGSSGWWANVEGATWFAERIWPGIFRTFPAARLHLFGLSPGGAPPPGAFLHDAPMDSRAVFAPGSVFVVPLRSGSGVRMKILEAWARGAPVLATPAAAAGLEESSGLLVASDPASFEAAFRRLQEENDLRGKLVADGRATLARFHDPLSVARATEKFALGVAARNQGAGGEAGSIGTDRPSSA